MVNFTLAAGRPCDAPDLSKWTSGNSMPGALIVHGLSTPNSQPSSQSIRDDALTIFAVFSFQRRV